MSLTQRAILKEALKKYGEPNQLNMLKEECAELIVAISHFQREREASPVKIAEECADVEILIDQFKTVPRFERLVKNKKLEKLKRLMNNLKKE